MYIGLDLGTSGLKGVLIDDAQGVLAEAAIAAQGDHALLWRVEGDALLDLPQALVVVEREVERDEPDRVELGFVHGDSYRAARLSRRSTASIGPP